MKQKYIDSLLSEIQQLRLRVENSKRSQKVPFSFFRDSFKSTQEITRLLHELEFMQIDEMKGQMEKLVHFLSDVENAKKEVDESPEDSKNDIENRQETTPIITIPKNKEENENYLAFDGTKRPELTDTQTHLKESTTSFSSTSNHKFELSQKNKSLNDVQPTHNTIQDVMRSISLNDRFLFQRELFDNNREKMNAMLAKLQSYPSFDLVESYLKKNTDWDFRDEVVDKFLQMQKERFR